MHTADDLDEVDENLARVENSHQAPRASPADWLLNRRRIEQAHEQRELNRALADFEDYIV